MRHALLIVAALILFGCEGEAGPTGPQGQPGTDGQGYEFQQFGGLVPTTGSIEVTVPFLRMSCPPMITVYFETTPGNWIAGNILDNFTDGGESLRYEESYIMRNNAMTVFSVSAISFNRPTPFVVTMFAPEGYFESGYRCP